MKLVRRSGALIQHSSTKGFERHLGNAEELDDNNPNMVV